MLSPQTTYRFGVTESYIKSGIDAVKEEAREKIAKAVPALLEEPIKRKVKDLAPDTHQRFSSKHFLSVSSAGGKGCDAGEKIYSIVGIREKAVVSTSEAEAIEALKKRGLADQFLKYKPLNKIQMMQRLKSEFTKEDRAALRGVMSDFTEVSNYVTRHKERFKEAYRVLSAYESEDIKYIKRKPLKSIALFDGKADRNEAIEAYIFSQKDSASDLLSDYIEHREKMIDKTITVPEFIFRANSIIADIDDLTRLERKQYSELFEQNRADEELQTYYTLIEGASISPRDDVTLDAATGVPQLDTEAIAKRADEVSDFIEFEQKYSIVIESPTNSFYVLQEQIKRLENIHKFTIGSADESMDEGIDLNRIGNPAP